MSISYSYLYSSKSLEQGVLKFPLCSVFCNLFILSFITVAMGAIPQKWLFACHDCGCIFTTMAEKQTGLCPVCKSSDMDKIEGFKY